MLLYYLQLPLVVVVVMKSKKERMSKDIQDNVCQHQIQDIQHSDLALYCAQLWRYVEVDSGNHLNNNHQDRHHILPCWEAAAAARADLAAVVSNYWQHCHAAVVVVVLW